ncbi:reverse transcriptase, RNA-dependent DNA polymerase, Gag-polypeptide of LTR copia-type [Artemisia annua]|uniref:Reverse transcriptase, RNA-dependent DNA polymerase, Gag-polypeptide of LTR copia-type n=1 Tax=Artemisia annua TaxID=35608 RepID=A0A2U1MG65_ARTAN|nr:reverse transcriptase, RNA-dependent DNA polymerase, Gag-polypeptide of LTR copia-type [Artemisia annua]
MCGIRHIPVASIFMNVCFHLVGTSIGNTSSLRKLVLMKSYFRIFYLTQAINSHSATFKDFDSLEVKTKTPSLIPNDANFESNDKEGASVGREGSPSQPGKVVNIEHTVNLEQIQQSATLQQPVEEVAATPLGEIHESEGNKETNSDASKFQNVSQSTPEEGTCRRSLRVSRLPAKFNEFVLNDKVKYGVGKYANHSVLNPENCCFVSNLNKVWNH